MTSNSVCITNKQKEFFSTKFKISKKQNIQDFIHKIESDYINVYNEKPENPRELAFHTLQKIKNYCGLDNTVKKCIHNQKKRKIKNVTDYLWIDQLLHNANYKLPIFPGFKGLWLRIPYNNILQVLPYLRKYIGKESLILQQSYKRDILILYKFDTYINPTVKEKLPKHLENLFEFEIKVFKDTDHIHLPFGFVYYSPMIYEKGELLILGKPNLITEAQNLHNAPINPYPTLFKEMCIEKIQYYLKDKKEKIKDFTYGCGTRHHMFFYIGFNLLHKNKNATLEDFTTECEKWNNGTSKDMNLTSYRKDKLIYSYWKFFMREFKEVANFNLISNKPVIKDNHYTIYYRDNTHQLSTNQKFLIQKICKEIILKNKFIKNSNSLPMQKLLTSCSSLFEEIWKKSFYIKKRKYVNKINKPLEKGVHINHIEFNTIAKNIPSIQNIRLTKKILELTGLITAICNAEGKYYQFNSNEDFCKHYELVDITTSYLHKHLQILIKSIYPYIYTNNINYLLLINFIFNSWLFYSIIIVAKFYYTYLLVYGYIPDI